MTSYNTYTDEQLLELLKSSDEHAFTEIYKRYAETLFRFSWNILKEENECTDAIQDVFVWFWENRERLQVTVLKFYLLAAVKYRLARVIRNSKRKAEILAAHPVNNRSSYMEETIELKELKTIIQQFTETLPPRAKEIFLLSRNEHLTNREIATKLNISEKTVENQITISLKKLRPALDRMHFWFFFL